MEHRARKDGTLPKAAISLLHGEWCLFPLFFRGDQQGRPFEGENKGAPRSLPSVFLFIMAYIRLDLRGKAICPDLSGPRKNARLSVSKGRGLRQWRIPYRDDQVGEMTSSS